MDVMTFEKMHAFANDYNMHNSFVSELKNIK